MTLIFQKNELRQNKKQIRSEVNLAFYNITFDYRTELCCQLFKFWCF